MPKPKEKKSTPAVIEVYLAQPLKPSPKIGYEKSRPPEIAFIRKNRLLAVRELSGNVINLADLQDDDRYTFNVLKRYS